VNDLPQHIQDIKDYLTSRRNTILAELASKASPFSITSGTTSSTANYTLIGRAPAEVATIQVFGAFVAGPTTWPLVTTWNIPLILNPGPNNISIQGYDWRGVLLPGYTANITVTYTP
jgi:hypothetical protein